MQITLILGGDGARFAHDLASRLGPDDTLTVVAPVVRGHVSAGLVAGPDLDALLTPPGAGGSFTVADRLEAVGYVPSWQRADDAAVAARLVRTDLTTTGTSLTDATVAAATRAALPFGLLPACDDRAELRVVIGTDADARAIHVEEYLADPAAHEPTQLLLVADAISVSPAVAQTLRETDVLVLGPSSRTLAIDPVLRTPGVLDLVPDDLPVLVVDHAETAPADLVRVAGLRQGDPGSAERVDADPSAVVELARKLTA